MRDHVEKYDVLGWTESLVEYGPTGKEKNKYNICTIPYRSNPRGEKRPSQWLGPTQRQGGQGWRAAFVQPSLCRQQPSVLPCDSKTSRQCPDKILRCWLVLSKSPNNQGGQGGRGRPWHPWGPNDGRTSAGSNIGSH